MYSRKGAEVYKKNVLVGIILRSRYFLQSITWKGPIDWNSVERRRKESRAKRQISLLPAFFLLGLSTIQWTARRHWPWFAQTRIHTHFLLRPSDTIFRVISTAFHVASILKTQLARLDTNPWPHGLYLLGSSSRPLTCSVQHNCFWSRKRVDVVAPTMTIAFDLRLSRNES